MKELGGCRDCTFPAATAGALLDRNRRRKSIDCVDLRTLRGLYELARVRIERFEIATLSLGEKDIEGERALSASGYAGEHGHVPLRNFDGDVLQVVLTGIHDSDRRSEPAGDRRRRFGGNEVSGFRPLRNGHGETIDLRNSESIPAQRLGSVAGAMRDKRLGRTGGHQPPAAATAVGSDIDNPVGVRNHVEVVLDYNDAVPFAEQASQGGKQACDILRVKAGSRFIEEKEHGTVTFRRGGLGQVRGKFQALCFATGEGWYGLTKGKILEPDIDKRLQTVSHRRIISKQPHGIGDGHGKHVGHIRRAHTAVGGSRNGNIKDFASIARTVAVGTAQIHIAQKLHFHVLETGAPAGRAAAVTRVKAECPGRVSAIDGKRGRGESLSNLVECSDVTCGVGPRRFSDTRLVDEHRFVDCFDSLDRLVGTRRFDRFPLCLEQRPVEGILHKRAFAASRDTGNADKLVERNGDIGDIEVVAGGAGEAERAGRGGDLAGVPCVFVRGPCAGRGSGGIRRGGAGRGLAGARTFTVTRRLAGGSLAGGGGLADGRFLATSRCRLAEPPAGGGVGARKLRRSSLEHDSSPVAPGAGAELHDPVRGGNDLRIMFDNQQSVASLTQPPQYANEPVYIPGMQADTRFIEHEQRVGKPRSERCCKVNALNLATTQRS